MWLPTDTIRPAVPTARRSLSRLALLAVLLITALLSLTLLSGCAGYQFAGKEKGIFGDPSSTLRMVEVENPTMYAWLPHRLRSLMRDEVHRRNLARWVDTSPSDYSMRIIISEFRLRSHARDASDTTLLYSATLGFEAIVYSGTTNSVVWRSGKEYLSRTYDSKNPEEAGTDAAHLLVQRVADRMRHSF